MAWAPDYVTVQELKDHLRIPDDTDDTTLATAISAASRAIDQACNRQFGLVAAPEPRYYTPEFYRTRGRWVIKIDDLMTITGLEVNADLGDTAAYEDAITEYALRPVNAMPSGRPWTEIVVHPDSDVIPTALEASVEVTARFGWTTTPEAVKQACLLQASRLFARRDAPFGVAGSPTVGSEMRLLAKVDPDVEVSLRAYHRYWGAA